MKKLLIIFLVIIFFNFRIINLFAGSDGTLELSKKNNNNQNVEVKDCFETLNRGIFAFNTALDKIFLNLLQRVINFFQNQLDRELAML